MAEEMKLITDITLELTGEMKRYEVVAKQGDKATRYVRISVRNNGQEFEIPEGMKVIANIKKPDRKHCYNTCTYTGSRIMVELTNQALAAAGTAECDIEIRDEDDTQILSTQAFTIEIEESKRDENAIVSSNEYTALEKKFQKNIENEIRQCLLKDMSLGIHSNGKIYIMFSGEPIGDGIIIESGTPEIDEHGDPIVDAAVLTIASGGKKKLGIKLSKKPTYNQNITIMSENTIINIEPDVLTFTPENWDEMQYVTISIGSIDKDETSSIVIRNDDELQTDITIPIYMLHDVYSVDTTIPEDAHVITENDVTGILAHDQYGAILKQYTGGYNNVIVPSSIVYEGKSYSPVAVSPDTFSNNNYVEYITLEDGAKLSGSSTNITSSIGSTNKNFAGASALIGIKIPGYESLNMDNLFENCTNLKFVDGLEKTKKITGMKYAFRGCTSLEYIQDLSEVDTDRDEKNNYTDGNYAFRDCTALKKVYGLPPLTNATGIFYGCTNLEEAIIPETVGTYEFEYNGGYENSGYASFAFYGCINLKKITVLTEVATPGLPNQFNNICVIYAIEGSEVYTSLSAKVGSLPNVQLIPYGSSIDGKGKIVVWGDSTSSYNTGWKDWPTRLGEKVKEYNVKNQAVSGEYTTSTSARQGGNKLKVGAFKIKASETPLQITLKSEDGQIFGENPVFSAGASFNPCTINGVKGTITYENGGKYNFTRLDAGDEIDVDENTIVTSNVDDMFNASDVIMLINLGINSGWNEDAEALLNQVQMMVDHFVEKGGTKYIVCGPCAGKYLRTEGYREIVFSYEEKAAASFGEHWLNLREYMIENGLTKNDLVASQLDTERMENGQVPASLLGGGTTEEIKMYNGIDVTDDTHPNAYGANTQYLAFYEKGVELGYWS